MTFTRLILICLVLLLAAGCATRSGGESEEPGEAYDFTATVIDGVQVVNNPETPWKGRVRYAAADEVSIGVEEGEEPYMLNRPVDLKVDAEGRIYVLDWGDTRIQVYDAGGVYVRTIGRKGQGPGEFDTPCYFDISADGRLFIMDGRNQRVTVFDPEGKHRQDFRIQGFYSGMVCDPKNRPYSQTQTTMKEAAVSDDLQEIPLLTSIYRIDPDTGERFHMGDFEGETRMSRRTEGGGYIAVAGLFMIAWSVSPEGKLYLGYNGIYQLGIYSESGQLEFRFGRAYTPVPRPKTKSQWAPKLNPAFNSRRLVFDEEGNLWLEQYAAEGFEGFLYDVFTPDGIFLRQAVVPYPVYVFRHGRAYSLVRPEDGFSSAKSYRLIASPRPSTPHGSGCPV